VAVGCRVGCLEGMDEEGADVEGFEEDGLLLLGEELVGIEEGAKIIN